MQITSRKLSTYLFEGALFGAAAWSAYTVAEFLLTSVVYRLTRPYATFTSWHWRLTALVVVGYLACGVLAGAIGGLAIWLRPRPKQESGGEMERIGLAAELGLIAALLLNMVTGPGAVTEGPVQIAEGLVFLLLVFLSLRSLVWRNRIGWVTNPWIVSFTWLGTGLAFSILRMRLGSQLGHRLDLAAAGLAGAIVLAVIAAVFAGRRLRTGSEPGRWPLRLSVGSCTTALLLLAGSLVLAGSHAVVAEARSAPAASTSTSPNLVMIVMDTVRADHLSLDGYSRSTTPRLKELARDSVVYTNAFSASDITLTSHASLFTGLYPSWHGAYSQPPTAIYGRELAAQYPTLAELLQRSGYETLGVAANLYLRADFGLERGFEDFRIPRPVPLLPDEDRFVLRYRLRQALSYVADTAQFDRLYTFGEDVNQQLLAALDHRARPSAPFFAFANYMDAHFPYVPPAPYNQLFPGRRPHVNQDVLGEEMEKISAGQGVPPEYRTHCESQYDGGIAYIDAQIGRVVDWLKHHDVYDNTMIVVTSDHGESFGEKNRVGHANSPYQNLLHTALLIKYPRASRKGVEANPVSLIDVAPTAMKALGLPAPSSFQGVALGDGAPAPRRIYAETFQNPVTHSPDCPQGCVTKVLVEWPFKYVDNRTNGKPEFFDLATDPHEEHNRFAVERERAEPLAAHLAEWSKALPAQSLEVKRVNPAIENTLRGNGYIAK